MRLIIVILFVCVAVAFPTASADTKPVLIGQHIIKYVELSNDDLMHSVLSQRYPDLGGRFVQSVYSMEVPSYTTVDLRGVEFDFIVGRRSIGSHTAYNFQWDALAVLNTQLALTMQIFETSNITGQPSTLQQGALYEMTITLLANKTDIYLFFTHPIANIYKASFILPASAVTGKALMLPSLSAKSVKTRFWLGVIASLNSQDEASGYEYTFRLPISPAIKGSMSLRDPDNILGLGYRNWTDAVSIANILFAGMTNPVMAFRMAGYVTLPSIANTSPTSVLLPPPTSALSSSSSIYPSPLATLTPTPMPSPTAVVMVENTPSSPSPLPIAISTPTDVIIPTLLPIVFVTPTSAIILTPISIPIDTPSSPKESNSSITESQNTVPELETLLLIAIGVIIAMIILPGLILFIIWYMNSTKRHAYSNVEQDQETRDALNVQLDFSDEDQPSLWGENKDDKVIPLNLLGSRMRSTSEGEGDGSHPTIDRITKKGASWLGNSDDDIRNEES